MGSDDRYLVSCMKYPLQALDCAVTIYGAKRIKDVKLIKSETTKYTTVQIKGETADILYSLIPGEEVVLKPWTNVGKEVIDREGNHILRCLKYTEGGLGCALTVRK